MKQNTKDATIRSWKQAWTRSMQILNNLSTQLFVIIEPRFAWQAFRLLLVPINAAGMQMPIGQR